MSETPFPKRDGDRFTGNMGDEMVLAGGSFYLWRTFNLEKWSKENERREKEHKGRKGEPKGEAETVG